MQHQKKHAPFPAPYLERRYASSGPLGSPRAAAWLSHVPKPTFTAARTSLLAHNLVRRSRHAYAEQRPDSVARESVTLSHAVLQRLRDEVGPQFCPSACSSALFPGGFGARGLPAGQADSDGTGGLQSAAYITQGARSIGALPSGINVQRSISPCQRPLDQFAPTVTIHPPVKEAHRAPRCTTPVRVGTAQAADSPFPISFRPRVARRIIMQTQALLQRNTITLKGSAQIVTDFFQHAVNKCARNC